jgi:hypothetical protein
VRPTCPRHSRSSCAVCARRCSTEVCSVYIHDPGHRPLRVHGHRGPEQGARGALQPGAGRGPDRLRRASRAEPLNLDRRRGPPGLQVHRGLRRGGVQVLPRRPDHPPPPGRSACWWCSSAKRRRFDEDEEAFLDHPVGAAGRRSSPTPAPHGSVPPCKPRDPSRTRHRIPRRARLAGHRGRARGGGFATLRTSGAVPTPPLRRSTRPRCGLFQARDRRPCVRRGAGDPRRT